MIKNKTFFRSSNVICRRQIGLLPQKKLRLACNFEETYLEIQKYLSE